jgi:hypothetical protein
VFLFRCRYCYPRICFSRLASVLLVRRLTAVMLTLLTVKGLCGRIVTKACCFTRSHTGGWGAATFQKVGSFRVGPIPPECRARRATDNRAVDRYCGVDR